MKPENLELAVKMGFHRRRTLHGLADGIDWSSGCYGYDSALEDLIQEVREQEQEKADELKKLVNKLFTEYLDVQEESDSGRMFHPITISCCRAAKLQPLSDLLERLKELSK